MCGILGLLLANDDEYVNQMLFDGLTVLQHRGQDDKSRRLHLRKDNGLVRDVFQTHHMIELRGNVGLGHCRYPTAGSSSCAEAQPLYTNYPFGICFAHNGNLVNTEDLSRKMRDDFQRHANTDSDSELLLNMFAEHMVSNRNNISTSDDDDDDDEEMVSQIFSAVKGVMTSCKGGYSGIYLINGVGIVGVRDPHGIRPLVFGTRVAKEKSVGGGQSPPPPPPTDDMTSPRKMKRAGGKLDYLMASESVVLDTLGFNLVRDVKPGEAIFISMKTGNCHTKTCHPSPLLAPCIFEYVYFARPDSIMDGVSVYEARLKMGEKLAQKVLKTYPSHDIDVVIPIPDTSRTSALQAAYILGRPFREGFIKNRYIARTFIMPGQAARKKSVRLKLNTIKSEFVGRNILLVDDSVVRGTTAREIVQMSRDAGAQKVYLCSAAPPIRYPNIYGIDIPTRRELVAFERDEDEISRQLGCDWILYQDLDDLKDTVRSSANPEHPLNEFDTSCFSGTYITGETIDDTYFTRLYELRNDKSKSKRLLNGSHHLSRQNDDHQPPKRDQSHDDGCEPVLNDKREGCENGSEGCEAIRMKP